MIIRSLHLKNFRSFEEAHLEFSDRQNYVFGQNWQGKSSIVDAIGFALFGTDVFPRKLAGTAVKAEHLVWDRGGRAAASVEVRFELGGEDYTLRRTVATRDIVLSKDGKRLASGATPVREKLIELSGIDAKLFQNIFYSDQDELRKSLEFTPDDRRQFVEQLLGVEEWKLRIEFLRTTAKQLRAFREDLVSGRLSALLEARDRMEEHVAALALELRDKQRDLKKLRLRTPKNIAALRGKQRASDEDIADLQQRLVAEETRQSIEEKIRNALRKGTCPTCTQIVPPTLRRSRLKVLDVALRSLSRQLVAMRRELEGLEDQDESSAYEESYQDVVSVADLAAEVRGLERQIGDERKQLGKLTQQARAFGKKPEQVDATDAEIRLLETLEAVVQEHRKSLRERLVAPLQVGMNDFLARFHDGDNDAEVKIDGDLNFAVKLHGRDVPIFNLSGSMKDILALALRYGLLRVAARSVNFMVLDEPTRHMDSVNSQRLKGIFNDLLDRQLIVVTINSEFGDAAGKHFLITKDTDLRSQVARSW